MLIVSGMARTTLYPFAAPTIARAIPVFPLVGSTITVLPGSMLPWFSASRIIARPMRSLTLPPGFMNSHFATRVPVISEAIRLSRTNGVPAIKAVTSGAIEFDRLNTGWFN